MKEAQTRKARPAPADRRSDECCFQIKTRGLVAIITTRNKRSGSGKLTGNVYNHVRCCGCRGTEPKRALAGRIAVTMSRVGVSSLLFYREIV